MSALSRKAGSHAALASAVTAAVLCAGPPGAARARAGQPAQTGGVATGQTTSDIDEHIQRARALYDRGKAKFETAQYLEAIELWTEAYGTVPDEPGTARIKALLIYNIASAQQRAFEIQRDPKHLRQAKVLMENYAQNIPQLYEDEREAEAERAKIEARLQEIEATLASTETRAGDSADEEETAPVVASSPTEGAADGGKRRRTLLVTGGTLAGLGVVGLGVMAGGLAMGAAANDLSELMDDDIEGRRAQFDRGRAGNVLAWTGGFVGGALLVTGAVLVGLGVEAGVRKTAAAPFVSPHGAGLAVRGRF